MRLSTLAPMALALVALPTVGLAQTTAAARGFPIGEKSRLHLNLDVGVVYDTNPFRLSPTARYEDVRAQVRPGLEIEVPGSSFEFRLGGKLSIEQLFGVSDLGAAQTFVGGDVGVKMRAGSRTSVLGFELSDNLTRTPTYFDRAGTLTTGEIRFPTLFNVGRAGLVIRPGGGALELRTAYTNTLTFYDDLPDGQQHGVAFQAKLKFLPRTAAIFDADLSFFSTTLDGPSAAALGLTVPAGSEGILQRAAPYNVSVGLLGQITPRLQTTLRIGFGDALNFQPGEGFFGATDDRSAQRTVIGEARLVYAFTDNFDGSLGYQRQVIPTIILRSFVSDAIQAALNLKLAERLSINGFAQYDFRGFADVDARGLAVEGSTQVLTADVRISYQFFDYLTAGVGYQMINQIAGDAQAGLPSNPFLDEYTRHMVLFNVALRY
jgi:hypothetical protein